MIAELLEEAEKYVCSHAGRVRLPSYEPEDVRQELRIIALAAAKTFDPAHGVPWTAYVCRRLSLRGVDLMRDRGVVSRCGRTKRQPHISYEATIDDQHLDLWEPADEGDEASDVEWRDLVIAAGKESQQVRAIILRAGGLTMRAIADQLGVSEPWVCMLLKTTHPQYSESIRRIRYLIGRDGDPMHSDRWSSPEMRVGAA